jgi:hypothetical protein
LHRTAIALVLGLLAAAVPLRAQQTWVLVIAGIGGEPKYTESFQSWGEAIVTAAQERAGVPAANVTYLAEKEGAARATGVSRKEAVQAAFASLAQKATASDLVFVVILGHGSFLNNESRVNLPGPDLTAQDFAVMLQPIQARIAFANTTSSSGEFAKVLAGPNRAIVTATKSGMERNEAVFGGYFAQAFADDVADTDKDGRISLLEAYEYARVETQRFYEGQTRLMTEHAQIVDSGDAPSAEAGPGKPNGALAARMFLGGFGAPGAPANASPALRALYERRRGIENRVEDLKAVKDTMDPVRYEQEIEQLLLELAQVSAEIRRMEGGG